MFLLDSYGNAVLMSLIWMLKGVVILEEMLEVAYCMIHPETHGRVFSLRQLLLLLFRLPLHPTPSIVGKSILLPSYNLLWQTFLIKRFVDRISLSSSGGVSIRAARQKKKSLWKPDWISQKWKSEAE